jgi:putative acetyltransferase
MTTENICIQRYRHSDREQILKVWERSVAATHHFLDPGDFEEIRKLVHGIDFDQFEVYCLKEDKEVVGFIGLADRKIEMLFLSPDHFGKGFGRKLVEFAVSAHQTDSVDVNEQNRDAVEFYEKLGFMAYERRETDDLGFEYPLLRMSLDRV